MHGVTMATVPDQLASLATAGVAICCGIFGVEIRSFVKNHKSEGPAFVNRAQIPWVRRVPGIDYELACTRQAAIHFFRNNLFLPARGIYRFRFGGGATLPNTYT